MRGRKPKSDKVHYLNGNPSKKKDLDPGRDDIYVDGDPGCPSWLPRVAKEEWKRVTKELKSIKLLKKIDRSALTAYCQAYSMLHDATKLIAKEGMLMKTEKGNWIQHPAVGIASKARESIRQYCAEFGFTPSARCRLDIKSPERSAVEEFLEESEIA